mgnify:CR=1 FL=1
METAAVVEAGVAASSSPQAVRSIEADAKSTAALYFFAVFIDPFFRRWGSTIEDATAQILAMDPLPDTLFAASECQTFDRYQLLQSPWDTDGSCAMPPA